MIGCREPSWLENIERRAKGTDARGRKRLAKQVYRGVGWLIRWSFQGVFSRYMRREGSSLVLRSNECQMILDKHDARRGPSCPLRDAAFVPCANLAFQRDCAARHRHSDAASFQLGVALKRVFDPLLDVDRIDVRTDGNQVRDANDTEKLSDRRLSSHALELPFNVAGEGDPSLFHFDLDGLCHGNGSASRVGG